jgi:hypothetical protein
MQCEAAPCEPVCPVEALVHDHEGLNVQVYNRCVGTRFCESNCPYKVRRFNFFGYADGQEYGNLGDALIKAANNPDVSVRARRHREVHLLRPAHQPGAAERETRLIARSVVEDLRRLRARLARLSPPLAPLSPPSTDARRARDTARLLRPFDRRARFRGEPDARMARTDLSALLRGRGRCTRVSPWWCC